jgi:tripartite-type tricarboxylate transporter receptor subunit TctC
VRPIAAATERRIPALPDTPTFEESGIPNLDRDVIGWVGIVAPAGTPRDIVTKLNREIVRAAALPEMAKVYSAMNVIPATTTPEQLAQKIDREIALWGPVIKGLNIQME